MLKLFKKLVRHKVYANAALLSQFASMMPRLTTELLHHIILANRFWFSLVRGSSFQVDEESRVPDSRRSCGTLSGHAQARTGMDRCLNLIWPA